MSASLLISKPPVGVINKADYPIFAICKKVWHDHPGLRHDCSGYLKAVARLVGVPFSHGLANDMLDWLTGNPLWQNLGHDAATAAKLSAQGYFVVAGAKEARHGHVVVIVPGWAPQGAAMGYWGKLHGIGECDKSLTWAWVGQAKWNSPQGLKDYPHKAGALSPLEEVVYFAAPALSLKPSKKP